MPYGWVSLLEGERCWAIQRLDVANTKMTFSRNVLHWKQTTFTVVKLQWPMPSNDLWIDPLLLWRKKKKSSWVDSCTPIFCYTSSADLFFYFKPFPMNRLSVPFWADLELLLVVPGHGRMQLKLLIVLSFQSEPTHKQHLKGSVNNFSYSVNFQHFVTFNHTATIQDPIQFSDKECFWLDNFLIYINNNNYNNGSNIIIINN